MPLSPSTEPQLVLHSQVEPLPISPVKRMSWKEMQKWRSQGLCFNFNDKFTTDHKRCGLQLKLFEATNDDNLIKSEVPSMQTITDSGP